MVENEEQTALTPITLPLEVWGQLALQAHERDMKLNDYLVKIIMAKVAMTKGMKMCADDWLKYHPDYEGVTVTDPDGWDRKNFEESWAEEIARDEFERRMLVSTSVKKS